MTEETHVNASVFIKALEPFLKAEALVPEGWFSKYPWLSIKPEAKGDSEPIPLSTTIHVGYKDAEKRLVVSAGSSAAESDDFQVDENQITGMMGATFRYATTFSNITFLQTLSISHGHFDRLISFRKCEFRKWLMLAHTRILDSLRLVKCAFGAKGGINLVAAEIAESLIILGDGVHSIKSEPTALHLAHATVQVKLQLEAFKFSIIDGHGLHTPGLVKIKECLAQSLNFQYARISALLFEHFDCQGDVLFGDLECSNIVAGILAEREEDDEADRTELLDPTIIGGELNLNLAKLGILGLENVAVNKVIAVGGSSLQFRLNLGEDKCEIYKSRQLSGYRWIQNWRCDEDMYLLICGSGRITGERPPSDEDELRGDVLVRNCEIAGALDLRSALGQTAKWGDGAETWRYRRVDLSGTSARALDVVGPAGTAAAIPGALDLTNARIGTLYVSADSFPGDGDPPSGNAKEFGIVLDFARIQEFHSSRGTEGRSVTAGRTSEFPVPVSLLRVKVDTWFLQPVRKSTGQGTSDTIETTDSQVFLDFLDNETQFRMSSYSAIERDLRERGLAFAADEIYCAARYREAQGGGRWKGGYGRLQYHSFPRFGWIFRIVCRLKRHSKEEVAFVSAVAIGIVFLIWGCHSAALPLAIGASVLMPTLLLVAILGWPRARERLWWSTLRHGTSAWRPVVLIIFLFALSYFFVAQCPKNIEPTVMFASSERDLGSRFDNRWESHAMHEHPAEGYWSWMRAFWITVRYHVPLMDSLVTDEWQPADGPLIIAPPWSRCAEHPPGPTGLTAQDWFGLMRISNWILWTLSLSWVLGKVMRSPVLGDKDGGVG